MASSSRLHPYEDLPIQEIITPASTSLPPPSSSSASPPNQKWTYDVFLSFRGEDTRNNFVDHLYTNLTQKGIHTFLDEERLERGKEISGDLLKAIEESRFAIIIFSENYASSSWCLDELVKIIDCTKETGQIAYPVFYNVDPSNVRSQKGSFAKAFDEHEKKNLEKMKKWRKALSHAGSISGWDTRDRSEAKIIEEIVEHILDRLNRLTDLVVAIHPVGFETRVRALDSKILVHNLGRVQIIGFCGMGGLGKTSLAKAVFNQFFPGFKGGLKGRSYLANIREISKQPDGLLRLQQQLLSDILRGKKENISSVDMGINVIKERLCNVRVLVVLDDVDHLDQLHALGVKLASAQAREGDWGLGSRIIITTRDRHLLENIEVDSLHDVSELNDDESLELFSWHAFKRSRPEEGYVKLSKDVVSYCKGLPLALEVLGSHLSKKSTDVWTSALEKLKRIPHGDIQKKLEISYDALSDDTEKYMFLDIACFFIGMDKDDVIKILDGCKFYAETGITVLLDRCLMRVNEYNKLAMHDLLREMGREIVRREKPKNPGKRSRLWFCDDVLDVLRNQKGTDKVEGLVLKRPTTNELCAEAFAKMQGLRLLQVSYVHLNGDYGNISKELRWLFWHGFRLKFIPNDLHLENLIVIDMRYSNMIELWKGNKDLEKLKVLKLSHSHNLRRTPDLSRVPNLEKLVLKDCTSLEEVDPNIERLKQLRMLNLRDCKRFEVLPNSICRLRSLEILNLSGCSKFEKLPDDLGWVESLTELLIDGTLIKEDIQVPRSIVRLKNLKKFQKCGFQGSPSSFRNSLSLSWESPRKSLDPFGVSTISYSSSKELTLYNCKSPNEATMKDISLSSLMSMGIGSNNVFSIPASSSSLPNLNNLQLDHYMRLQSRPDLLEGLMIENAGSFHSTSTSTNDTWRPICSSSPGPVHADDSSPEDRTTAMEIARGIALPRDDHGLLFLKVVNTMIDVVKKLEAKEKEVENLKEQLVAQHDQVARARQLGYEEGLAATMTKMHLEEVAEEPVTEELAVNIFSSLLELNISRCVCGIRW